MWGTKSTLIPIDPKIERTSCTICRAKQKESEVTKEVKKELVEMFVLPWKTLGDYCRRTNSGKISLKFQAANPVTFDIKHYVFSGLNKNPFNWQAIRHRWEHLVKLYKTHLMCKPTCDITKDQIKLHLFGFYLIGRVKDWLKCIPNGTIKTWKEMEEKFLERHYSNAQFVETKATISNFS